MSSLGLGEVQRARQRIAGFAVRSPVVRADSLSQQTGVVVHLKLETVQPTGSFKVRGAANAIAALCEARRPEGVVTYSTGNHGRAVAHVGAAFGLPVTVCVGAQVAEAKLRLLADSGADIQVVGATQDDAAFAAQRMTHDRGLKLIQPFDDPDIIAGQGTIGLELLEQLPDVDLVVVPVSGGGLISGVALAIKAQQPTVRVVGVCAEHARAMYDSVRAGHPVCSRESPTLADSLCGGIGAHNQWTLGLVRRYVDSVVTVSEAQIRDALSYALREQGLVIEGAAAVGVAALLHAEIDLRGIRTAVVVVSGRNVDVGDLLAASGA